VLFHPVIRGKPSRAVEFTRVLHVPQLQNNLLSCLYLTCCRGLEIHISSNSIDFLLSRKTIFIASINSSNAAYLDRVTEPISEFAHISSTLHLDLNLWHRRFAHHNYADVRKMIREVWSLDLSWTQSSNQIPSVNHVWQAKSFPILTTLCLSSPGANSL
jgi:hypothetical protein